MKSENIMAVIEKLGEIIINYDNDAAYLQYENKRLKKQIESVEQYIAYYEAQDINDSDYKDAANNISDVSKSK